MLTHDYLSLLAMPSIGHKSASRLWHQGQAGDRELYESADFAAQQLTTETLLVQLRQHQIALIAAVHVLPSVITRYFPVISMMGAYPGSADYLGIFGSRSADQKSLETTQKCVESALAKGLWIVSGGARGVDRCAHKAAQGKTIIFWPGGLLAASASEWAFLQSQVAQGACVISVEYPTHRTHKGMFLQRNGLIVALSAKGLGIDVKPGSGSFDTLQKFQRSGKPIAVANSIASSLSDAQSGGLESIGSLAEFNRYLLATERPMAQGSLF
jgi:hypothetical protein